MRLPTFRQFRLHYFCSLIPTQAESNTWYRAVQLQFSGTPLNSSHTSSIASRFNPGLLAQTPFDILYLAENHMVALFEAQALLGSPYTPGGIVPQPRQPWTIVNAQVKLQRIMDLTDLTNQAILSTTAQELTGDWRGYQLRGPATSVPAPIGIAPTQELGAAISSVPNVEGFRTFSAKLPDQAVLIVFPRKLQHGSFITFSDKNGEIQTIRGAQ